MTSLRVTLAAAAVWATLGTGAIQGVGRAAPETGTLPPAPAHETESGSDTPSGTEIPIVELDGVVHAISAEHVTRSIDQADAAAAPLLIIRMDTPGGLDAAMRQVVDRILGSRTPIAVFVGPAGARAASAGFVIAIAADVVAMAPGTNMGAAHPVSGVGQLDEVMSEKLAQDAAAYVRSKAERRGRNPELAGLAVTESRSFTETEALEGGLIDLIAEDLPALLAALDGREIERFDGRVVRLALGDRSTRVLAMSRRQQVLATIARPEVLFLLLLGVFAGIGTELSHPGLVLPGVLGVFCLILFLFASQIIPVNWAGVLLIALGLALLAAEVKVTSYGLLTAGGVAAMGLGAMMLVDSPLPALRVSPLALWPAVGAMALFTTLLLRLVVNAHRRKPTTGSAGMVGLRGRTCSPLAPGVDGWIEVFGERWRARAGEEIGQDEPVTVRAVEGLTVIVDKGEP